MRRRTASRSSSIDSFRPSRASRRAWRFSTRDPTIAARPAPAPHRGLLRRAHRRPCPDRDRNIRPEKWIKKSARRGSTAVGAGARTRGGRDAVPGGRGRLPPDVLRTRRDGPARAVASRGAGVLAEDARGEATGGDADPRPRGGGVRAPHAPRRGALLRDVRREPGGGPVRTAARAAARGARGEEERGGSGGSGRRRGARARAAVARGGLLHSGDDDGGNGARRSRRISGKQRLLSVLVLVGLPYAREKLDALYVRLSGAVGAGSRGALGSTIAEAILGDHEPPGRSSRDEGARDEGARDEGARDEGARNADDDNARGGTSWSRAVVVVADSCVVVVRLGVDSRRRRRRVRPRVPVDPHRLGGRRVLVLAPVPPRGRRDARSVAVDAPARDRPSVAVGDDESQSASRIDPSVAARSTVVVAVVDDANRRGDGAEGGALRPGPRARRAHGGGRRVQAPGVVVRRGGGCGVSRSVAPAAAAAAEDGAAPSRVRGAAGPRAVPAVPAAVFPARGGAHERVGVLSPVRRGRGSAIRDGAR